MRWNGRKSATYLFICFPTFRARRLASLVVHTAQAVRSNHTALHRPTDPITWWNNEAPHRSMHALSPRLLPSPHRKPLSLFHLERTLSDGHTRAPHSGEVLPGGCAPKVLAWRQRPVAMVAAAVAAMASSWSYFVNKMFEIGGIFLDTASHYTKYHE